MKQDYAKLYDAYYYAHGCGQAYQRDEAWLKFFDTVAERITRDIRPTTVLDAGCAMGFLVKSLRQRGIEAFGVDVSEYAVQNVHPDIQPYCWVGSITDPFPQKYDLVVSIEVLEHMPRRDAELAVENFCKYSDDVLFSSSPLDYKESTHFNIQPPEYWAALFARYGFFRDVDFDASFIAPWTVRFRKTREPIAQVIVPYERRLWHLLQENLAIRGLNLEQRNELAEKDQTMQTLRAQFEEMQERYGELEPQAPTEQQRRTGQLEEIQERYRELERRYVQLENRWVHLEGSAGWTVMLKLQGLRVRLAPPHSVRDQALDGVFRALRTRNAKAFMEAMQLITRDVVRKTRLLWWKTRLRVVPLRGKTIQVEEITDRSPVRPHQATVDVIICVHNALADVQRCLESVLQHANLPYSLILVDDGSGEETRDYLSEFAQAHGATLLRNKEAQGYAIAANQGLRHSRADCVVLLNSDTIVTECWLDRLVACAESDPKIGLVGPLSNTASWQSIPEVESNGDWATNPLLPGITADDMGRFVARYSGRLYPTMPLLNGFCLLIKRAVIQEIGYFDEENFGRGYGEEDDYVLRARKAGWQPALADDTFIYHAQSRSYSNESRRRLSKRAGAVLAKKHGHQIISEGVAFCRHNRVLEGIRARSRVMLERQKLVREGQSRFEGRRILFVLPIAEPGGGANVVIGEAIAMRKMGVDVRIFNLRGYRSIFERTYPALQVPVIYGEREDLKVLGREYDALVATANFTVEWLGAIERQNGDPMRGYYVQGFEPYMYTPGTEDFQRAMNSYALLSDLKLFTKTEWTRQEVKQHTGAECALVGVSVNIDLFRPRPRLGKEWPDRPLRVAAMVRPSSDYRAPKMTMELLQRLYKHYRGGVEIMIFGVPSDDPEFNSLPRNFPWTLAGVLTERQVASFVNEVDVFVDFSSHQAMGLTALEAMACGAAVIVPARGGAVSFARHEENSLVVDTSSRESCWNALQRLVKDHELRSRLQRKALVDVCDYYPERPALNILRTLFVGEDMQRNKGTDK